ncbi:translation initiation factor eIF-2B subunit alpha [Bachmanniomyces sp. S44760]|nr:translation initiation factor eIF-2B subunit alpha [Bachmanniomyces sp. S44760]
MAQIMPSPPTSPPRILSTSPPSSPKDPSAMTRTNLSEDTLKSRDDEKQPFDIVKTYTHLLATDPDLTMPVAAIEALVLLLSQSRASTISETLDLLASSTAYLKRSIPNPIALSAGTDLFQRYLITTLQRPNAVPGAQGGDFRSIRSHLLSNGRLFVKRAKEARETIASFGRRFVRDKSVILTMGGSRVVGAVLRAAAECRENSTPIRFKVIYVQSPSFEGSSTISALRALGIPVATIPPTAVAYSMSLVNLVLVGAEGVVENGGIISRLGTYQLGLLAKSAGKSFYVVTESHKFVRLYPLGQMDLEAGQKVVDFRTDSETSEGSVGVAKDAKRGLKEGKEEKEKKSPSPQDESRVGSDSSPLVQPNSNLNSNPHSLDAIDYTPPDLITALITESGVHTPSAVSEELIKIWY